MICILSMALGAYCSVPDQRFYEFGLCLFSTKDLDTQYTIDELNADCSEFLLQKQTEIDVLKPLGGKPSFSPMTRAFSSARSMEPEWFLSYLSKRAALMIGNRG